MRCGEPHCPECGGRLVHQDSKRSHESSSALGQHVHDTLPTTFYWMDVDGAVYKRATRILRIIEHKNRDQSVRGSQRQVLPLLAIAVQGLVDANVVSPESGVYVMWSEGDFTSGAVNRVTTDPHANWAIPSNAVELGADTLRLFLSGESLLTARAQVGGQG